MEAKSLTILKRLAQLLRMRKEANSHPYHLFLSSRISLTPSLMRQVCDTDDWHTFRSYLSTLSPHDRLSILSLALQHAPPLEDYVPLSRLILAGYFTTVLTTNTDSALEDALSSVLVEQGMLPHSFQTLIADRDKDKDIAQALAERDRRIRIVKLYGSAREEKLPDTFPEIFTLRADLMESVRHYFSQDIVIVGSLVYDNAVNREIDRSSHSRIYYVPSRHPTKTDEVVQIIRARGSVPEDYLISGYYGEYARFFETLAEYTQQEKPRTPASTTSGKLVDLEDPGITMPASIPSPEFPDVVSTPPALRADVLLVTVTEIETDAVLQVFRETCGHDYQLYFIGKKTYYELGIVNDASVFLVQSEMGVSGPGSSLLTIHEGIQTLAPSNVIMVGIAFGVDAHKHHIGDILVSQQLRGYELQRYGTADDGTPSIILRGDRVTASVKLLDRFRTGYFDWPSRRGRWGKRVYFGTILSGETLIDNVDYRDQLRALEPEAIGGEMEGVGLYAAAHNAKVDWILVKAICDWADGNKSGERMAVSSNGTSRKISTKDRDQKTAAENAAQFTMHVLRKTRLV
jgi:nucleoside phosphorylase